MKKYTMIRMQGGIMVEDTRGEFCKYSQHIEALSERDKLIDEMIGWIEDEYYSKFLELKPRVEAMRGGKG